MNMDTLSISTIKVGDIIEFEYTGFMKKCTIKGKVVHLPSNEYDTMNVAVNPGNVSAVRPKNMNLLSIERGK